MTREELKKLPKIELLVTWMGRLAEAFWRPVLDGRCWMRS